MSEKTSKCPMCKGTGQIEWADPWYNGAEVGYRGKCPDCADKEWMDAPMGAPKDGAGDECHSTPNGAEVDKRHTERQATPPAPVSSVDAQELCDDLIELMSLCKVNPKSEDIPDRWVSVDNRIRTLAAELHKTKTVCDIMGKENERLRKMHTEEMTLSAKYFSENERLRELCARQQSRITELEFALEGKDD